MSRLAAIYLSYLALIAAVVCGAGCNGAPSKFNTVGVTTTTPSILAGGSAQISATVENDTSSAGVSWSLTGAGTLAGSTKTSVTYQAPSSVTAETVVTVKATSVTYPSSSNTIQITIEPPPAITTTSLPGTNAGASYSAQVNATGGVAPFTWSISAGSLTSQLALSASTGRSVTISGTPLSQTTDSFTIQFKDALGNTATQALSINIGAPLPLTVPVQALPIGDVNKPYPATQIHATGGVPTFTWQLTSPSNTLPPGLTLGTDGTITGTPTTIGTFTFSVLVTDSETPAMTAPGTLSIEVGNLAGLTGNYAFVFRGFDSSGNAVAEAGSFTVDGAGNITSGVEDVNNITTASKNQTFTGTYTLDSTGQGVMTFSSLSGSPAFAFALNAGGTHGRIIEFDSTGVRGSGDLELRNITACSGTTFSGNYAFGLMGHQAPINGIPLAGPVAIAGSFSATAASGSSTTGSLGFAELDANTPSRVTAQDKTVSGTFQASSEGTRCTMQVTSTLPTMNFAVYPISVTAAFLVETDTVNTTTPLLTSGSIQQQTGAPFSAASGSSFSSGVTSVASLTGTYYTGSTFAPDVAIASITGTGASSFTISGTENQGGNVNVVSPTGSNFIQADQFGRVATSPTTPFIPVFYMISQNTAYAIGEGTVNGKPDPFFGIFQPQSGGPFTSSTISGVFVEGTEAPSAPSVTDISGALELGNTTPTAGHEIGLQNQSASSGNSSAQTLTGTFSIADTNAGTGTLALTMPAALTGSFVIVSPSQMLVVTTTSGDTNPIILMFQQ